MTRSTWEDRFALESLGASHPRAMFGCGREPVDRFLKERALQAQSKRLSSSRVLVETEGGRIAGFYTLAMGQVTFGELPEDLVRKLPRRELPVAVIAWLGVDRQFQGKGLGTRLLAGALRDCWGASRTFPFVAVILDCLDAEARRFYERWSFRGVPGRPLRLFLSASELEAMMKTA